MLGYAIEFTPPMEGLEGAFNTFRLGRAWATRLRGGETVFLFDKKRAAIIGRALVTGIHTGALAELAAEHAHLNHNQKGQPKRGARTRLMDNMRRRYGPHIATDNKTVTVVYLERIE